MEIPNQKIGTPPNHKPTAHLEAINRREKGRIRAREDVLDVAWEAGMTEAVLPVTEEVPQREEVEGVGGGG